MLSMHSIHFYAFWAPQPLWPKFSWIWRPTSSATSTSSAPKQLQLLQLFRPNTIKWMTPLRPLTSHVRHAPFHTLRPSTPFSSRRLPTRWPRDLMNFGSWNEQPKEWKKLGDPSRPSWRTYTLHMIQERSELQRINGDSTMTFLLFLLQHRLPLYFLFYHIPNIRMCTLDNPFLRYQTILIFSNLAGDDPRSTTLKALLFHFIGHHGDRLHLLHQPEQLGEQQHNQWLRCQLPIHMDIRNQIIMVSPTCPTQVFKHFGTGKQSFGCLTPPLWFPQWSESLISIAQTFISWPQLWFIS